MIAFAIPEILSMGVRAAGERAFSVGCIAGHRKVIRAQLEHKFGLLSRQVMERLLDAQLPRLEQLAIELLDATSLKALGLED
jgi:hypothetical protein